MTDFSQQLQGMGFPTVAGGYGTIIADPPWSFQDKGSRAAPDWKAHTLYETMSAEDILAMPVDLLAAPAAHLYLWTTDVHLALALNVMDAWGFQFKKSLAWVKRRADSAPIVGEDDEPQIIRGPLHIGMGHYFRTAKELCLFGTRGRCPAAVHNLPDVFEGPRTQHSRKPDTLHEWAEKLSPGPRIELFARRSRAGWEGWGNQFPGHDAYLRLLGEIHKGKREARAVTTQKRARRRERLDFASAVQGVAKWAARCCECEGRIAQGDACVYDPETNVKACLPCAVEQGQIPDSTEAA